MKSITLVVLILLVPQAFLAAHTRPADRNNRAENFSALTAADTIAQSLKNFNMIMAGPFVNVVLIAGEQEHIRIEYSGISPEKINYSVRGKKLRIYLDDARYIAKTETVVKDSHKQKASIYRSVNITAYVTYKSLKNIQMRGEERLSCKDSLISNTLKIKLFGESEVDLAYVQARRLVVHLFGENTLNIEAGEAGVQAYRLFGENYLRLYASGEISLWGLGEVKMHCLGDPQLKRGLLGVSTISKR